MSKRSGNVPRSSLPFEDLVTALDWALTHAAPLFTAGELVVIRRILALPENAGELFARLTLRTGLVFYVADLRYDCATRDALAQLLAAGLVSDLVPDDDVLPSTTAPRLKEACLSLGFSASGRRSELEARLLGKRWVAAPVIRTRHRQLLWRCERLGGFDRALAPVDRIAGTIWAQYTPTGGLGPFPTRAAITQYERARSDEWHPGEAHAVALAGPPAFGPNNFRFAVAAVAAESPAADVWAAIPSCELLHARALESEGRLPEALAVCRAGAPNPETHLALSRSGRRIARSLRASWPPVLPLAEARSRAVALPVAAGFAVGSRPAWFARAPDGTSFGDPTVIENAIVETVRRAGRRCLHAENWLWTSVFALVFREAYFLPVAGMLPTPHRAGPIDLGSPTFYEKRRAFCDAQLSELEVLGLRPFAERWQGERLDGLFRPEQVVEHAIDLPGPLLANILRPFLTFGWNVARGLPDLLVLPGDDVRLVGAIPGSLPKSAFFAEIKGPTDALRDAQRLWHARLIESNIHVELWIVSDTSIG